MKKQIQQYIAEHLSPEPEVLAELYRETHCRVINPNMTSGHLQGSILGMIVKMVDPVYILEIGTYTGYSAIAMAMALSTKGTLYTIEQNDELTDISQKYFEKSGMTEKIKSFNDDALKIIPSFDTIFDLVFIDGNKREYCDYYNAVFSKVRKGGFIIADNILWGEKITDNDDNDKMTIGMRKFNDLVINDSRAENTIIPVRDGLMIIRKLSD